MAQKMSKKKKASAAVAGILAVVIAVGGAYAWVDYSQTARNTFRGNVAEGVLLHDDFDGQNKDVYVENTGDGEVYVRVKFAEYLQIGNTSVLPAYGENADAEEYRRADPNDVTTWPVHQFASVADENNVVCNGNADGAHKYFEWKMTGAAKDYLSGVTEADSNGRGGMTQEAFDALTPGVDFTLGSITTHKNSTNAAAPVMMLSEYLSKTTTEQNAIPACWLLDTDGWAYWSRALAPDTATNLLLDEVVVKDNSAPYDNAVYHIDVQLQAASVNEMDNWYANGTDVEVASPDNSIATTTLNGYNFVNLKAGNYITSADGLFTATDGKKYIALAPNFYREAEMSGTGYVGIVGTETIAGHDLTVGTDDDNMLAGRGAEWGGEVEIEMSSIDLVSMTYTIKGASDDFVVTTGIDKIMGTWDDVITSKTAALGTYEIDGDDTNGKETVGWNYLGGSLNKMLVATEYVLDNVQYNTSQATGNHYDGSNLKAKIEDIGTKMNITAPIVTVDLDMSMTQHTGNAVAVCTTPGHNQGDETHSGSCTTTYSTYYTNNGAQAQGTISGTQFFALSLNEELSAYGDSRDIAIRRYRFVQGAPAYARDETNTGSGNWNDSTSWKDGDGNPISSSPNWLRSPGYDAAHASYVGIDGNVLATPIVNSVTVGARPACYLNLSGTTVQP